MRAYSSMFATVLILGILLYNVFYSGFHFGDSLSVIFFLIIGISVSYRTLCYFLNHSELHVENGQLTVRHGPIPAFKWNKTIATSDIEQIYVMEKTRTHKRRTYYTYQLRAKTAGRKDQLLLNLEEVSSEKIQQIEEQLEQFLGIEDQKISGEYAKQKISSAKIRPRRRRRSFSGAPLEMLFQKKINDLVYFNDEEMQIEGSSQYDWKEGNTDKLFRLVNQDRETYYLFIEHYKEQFSLYEESEYQLPESAANQFLEGFPPKSIELEGKEYFQSLNKKGKHFYGSSINPSDVLQWLYIADTPDDYIRVISLNGRIEVYLGDKIDEVEMESEEDTLDLNSPVKDLDYDKPSWKEDIV